MLNGQHGTNHFRYCSAMYTECSSARGPEYRACLPEYWCPSRKSQSTEQTPSGRRVTRTDKTRPCAHPLGTGFSCCQTVTSFDCVFMCVSFVLLMKASSGAVSPPDRPHSIRSRTGFGLDERGKRARIRQPANPLAVE